jgi:hypothetical protein
VKKPTRPGLQVCPLCANDEFVALGSEGPDLWTFTCAAEAERHPYVWRPTAEEFATAGRTGLGDELGVYEDLLLCVKSGERIEYGIVEHRFALISPEAYATLVETYGHTSIAPTSYSASSFLARALGQLGTEGLLQHAPTVPTGYWSYNTTISSWSQRGESEATPVHSWSSFARGQGFDPDSWPATASLRRASE